MSNELRIKTAFVSEVLRDTAETIRAEQSKTAIEWNLFNTGELEKSLKGHFSLASSGDESRLSMRYLTYARILDMKDPRRKLRREGYHLYNRIIFGHLYNITLPRLKYGFTDDVKKSITKTLSEADYK